MLFRKFIEAEVPFNKTDHIINKLGDKYQPGTFGVEIEFKPNDTTDFDEKEAKRAFEKEVDTPTDPDEWLHDNPEPKKPDKKEYIYDPDDSFKNYYNLTDEDVYMPEDLPREYGRIITDLFDSLSEDQNRNKQWLHSLNRLYDELRRMYLGSLNKFMKTTDDFYKWIRAKKMDLNHLSSDKIQIILANIMNRSRNNGYPNVPDIRLTSEQMDMVDEFNKQSLHYLEEFKKYHEKRAESITKEQFDKEIIPIWKNDLYEWKREYSDWEDKKNEIESEYKDFDYNGTYDEWKDKNEERFIIYKKNDISDEINDAVYFFQKNKMPVYKNTKGETSTTAWNVFEDESGVVEIASPILTKKDFNLLSKVFNFLSDKEFDSDTGLHVHVGMSPITDVFDLLSVIYLIDEQAVLALSQRNSSSLSNYANNKELFFKSIYNNVESAVYSSDNLLKYIEGITTRYFGANVIHAFTSIGTVEFRYLSSQAIHNPSKIFELINYFMLLPNIAKSRNQIRVDFKTDDRGSLFITRRPGGKIEVKAFHYSGDQGKKVPKEQMPVQQLRQVEPVVDLKTKLAQKHKPKDK